jgi:photosystem II stability/assembly factor-like uncharacterized protein
MKSLFKIIFLFLFLGVQSSFSQWKMPASNAITPIFRPYNGGGLIMHHNGILWAGYKDIWMSSDTGKSWSRRTPFNGFNNSCIKDISFFDDNTGLATTQDGEIYITQNQGLSWQQHVPAHPFRFRPSIESACFAGDRNHIIACTYAGDRYRSSDGGNSWIVNVVDSFASQVLPGSGGTAYLIGGLFTGAWLYETNDYGVTWIKHPGMFNWDSYSFTQDECDTSVFYVANDDLVAKSDNSSRVFITTNTGSSWAIFDPHPEPYHCGSITSASHAIFVQTFAGISRSTDHGLSWKNIGGPPNITDTRFVTALDNNVIVAVDDQGSVWVTNNSGGDSLIYTDASMIALQTADQKTDTLGGSVSVPIRLNGISSPVEAELVVHYDPDLIYKGTYSLSNMQLDIPGQSWPGRSKIHITGATSTGILANSLFDVYSDSSKLFSVRFDSLTICRKSSPASAKSIITPVSGCGADVLTKFMRTNTFPEFRILPNPSGGNISIISSADLGEAVIKIYDLTGVKRVDMNVTLLKDRQEKINTILPSGLYHLQIHTSGKTFHLQFVVSR